MKLPYCCGCFALLVAGGCTHEVPRAASPPLPDVRLVDAFPNLSFERPVFLTHAGDRTRRLFVVEQAGRILVFPDRSDVAAATTFLDLREKVLGYDDQGPEGNEEGLLALAFHPQYRRNGDFYIYYSAARPRRTVLSRMRVWHDDPDRANAESEKVLLEIRQPYSNHNGGTLLFGPDGYLYLSIGDGGAANDPHDHGQRLSTLLSTIIRIDVNREENGRPYAIPKDNPFVGRDGAQAEIWAYGLRNVWRMSFDRKTGELWAGDVGQNLWEEINLIVRGGNYGWRIREGKHAFRPNQKAAEPWIDPVTEYGRELGTSVTGGYVYRGKKWKSLYGVYFYADYTLGTIFGLRFGNGKVQEQRILCRQPLNVASFGEDEAGELYVCLFGADGERNGKVQRLEPALP